MRYVKWTQLSDGDHNRRPDVQQIVRINTSLDRVNDMCE